MKKLLLSLSVIILFVLYSSFQRKTPTDISAIIPTIFPTPTQDYSNTSNSSANPTPTFTPPTPTPTATPTSTQQVSGSYKDGQYTGDVADAYYGNVQVKAIIQNGKITDVQFLQYPNDRRTSIQINSQAMPMLTSEAIQAQNGNVDIVSGATDTSQAFIASLGSALAKAH